MPVTPRGITSPNDPDNWDLIVDLAAMGSSIDTAIGNAASGRPGTAAARVTYTATAPNGFLWQDTDGIGMIWKKSGATWIPAVWRWAGTNAQMVAFTQAPNGFTWVDTATSVEYFRFNSAWSFGRAGFTYTGSSWDSSGGVFTGGTQTTLFSSGVTIGSLSMTPTIAGRWRFTFNGSWAENSAGLRQAAIARNDVSPATIGAAGNYAGVQQAASGRSEFSVILDTVMNGTTDNVTPKLFQNSGVRLTLTWSAMTAELLR